ncbi:hypothetical protein EHM76_06580, partial [bacterium]
MAATALVIISFPAGWILEKVVNKLMLIKKVDVDYKIINNFILILFFVLSVLLIFADSSLGTTKKYAAYEWLLGILAVSFLFLYSISYRGGNYRLLGAASIFIIILTLFVFPKQLGLISLAAGIVFYICSVLVKAIGRSMKLPIIYSVGYSIIIYLVLESLLKLYYPVEAGKWGEYDALQPHPTRVYSLIPGKTTKLKYNNYEYTLHTNSFGLASPEISLVKTRDTFRILIIGDAFSMPEGVEYEHSYPYLLGKRLNELAPGKKYQVINAGITGYGPMEQLPQLRELGTLLQPDLILYQFFINEFQEASLNISARLSNIGFITDGQSINESIFNNSQVVAHLKKLKSEIYDLISKRNTGWRYHKALLQFYNKDNNQLYDKDHLDKLSFYINSMKDYSDSIKADFRIMYVPGAVAVSRPADIGYYPYGINLDHNKNYDFELPLQNLHKITKLGRIPVYDLTPVLKNSPVQPVYFPDSWHWNKSGHSVCAKAIAEYILEGDTLPKNNIR